jgi:hypothetical protein
MILIKFAFIYGYRYTYEMRDQIHHEIESLVLDWMKQRRSSSSIQ